MNCPQSAKQSQVCSSVNVIGYNACELQNKSNIHHHFQCNTKQRYPLDRDNSGYGDGNCKSCGKYSGRGKSDGRSSMAAVEVVSV